METEQMDSGRWSPKPGESSHLMEAREIEQLLRTLHQSWEEGELKQALKRVEELFPSAPCQFEQNHAHNAVLDTMEHMRSDLEIQQMGLRVLSCFIGVSESIFKEMQQAIIVQFLIRILNDNTSEVSVQMYGMKILSKLLTSDDVKAHVSLDMKQLLIKVITKDMISFMDNCEMHVFTLTTLESLLSSVVNQGSQNLTKILGDPRFYGGCGHFLGELLLVVDEHLQDQFTSEHFDLFIDLLVEHTGDMTLVIKSFGLLLIFANTASIRQILVNHGILPRVCHCFKVWQSEVSVVEYCFHLLALLCQDERARKEMVEKNIIMETVVPELISDPESAELHVHGLNIFLVSAERLLQSRVEINPSGDCDIGSEWLKVIYIAMSRQMARQDVQEVACRALTKLLECKPDLHVRIGESSERNQDPLHTLCLGAILMYPDSKSVFTAACNAIFYLTADNEILCRSLMEKNTHIAVLEGLKRHMSYPEVVMAGCRALRGLCIFHDYHKEIVASYDGHVLDILVKALNTYHGVAAIQSEAISTIGCLADMDVVRHQCFVLKVHISILSAIDTFPGDEVLQETSIEALAVLGGAVNGPEMMYSLKAVNKISMCLKRFPYNINIQKKGLMAIQVLVDPRLLQSSDTCNNIIDTLKTAIHNFPKNQSIEKEAIVAMQILAERGLEGENRAQYSIMSQCLVDQGCHELLFTILERFDEDTKCLHELASECLYVIGIEQDLKSRMLVAACSKGFISGAECLIEIGADVNTGYGEATPLYRAVKNNDIKMVCMLLKQEIRDVQTPLRLSLQHDQHEITGLLLSHIGQDRENMSIQWSGYGLSDLRPEWILPSISGEAKHHASSPTKEHFVTQIRKSEQRRQQRLTHSRSEPFISESNRHKCFRFRRSSGNLHKRGYGTLREVREKPVFHINKTRRPHTFPKTVRPNFQITGREVAIKNPPSSPKASDFVPFHQQGAGSEVPGFQESSAEEEVTPLFMHSEEEWEDWKRTTLTGANIPFSPRDPRRPFDFGHDHLFKKVLKPAGRWLRKFNSDSLHPSDCPMQILEYSQLSSRNTSPIDFASDQELNSSRGESVSEETDLDTSHEEHFLVSSKEPSNTVTAIDVSSNQISSLCNLITDNREFTSRLIALQRLNLSNNRLDSIPEELFRLLQGLTHLNMSGNQLTTFPTGVGLALVSLDLSANKIMDLNLGKLTSSLGIQEINLAENKLASFPQDLDRFLPFLQKLNLASNKIVMLPSRPLDLLELRYLDLCHNQIVNIPDLFLVHCCMLETMLAANNRLENLPSEEIAASLKKLSSLKLSNNFISEREPFFIPKFVLELPNLRILDLAGNKLKGLPPPVQWKTQMLKELIVSRNKILKLNLDGAKAWNKLEKFHISMNKISELPPDIGYLVSLQSLDVSHNKNLSTLPDELGRCSCLWEMPLDGLTLDLDVKMIRGGVKDRISYLYNRLKKAQCYYRMKLMVVGYGGRGKTSLLQALKKRVRQNGENPAVTVGVIVDEWKFERQRSGRSVMYTINTWDFAGQEDFYSTHQCFLSNRTLYLVVYDISLGIEEVDRLKPWLANIHARAPGCPVIIVGTHYDLLLPETREEILHTFEAKLNDLMNKPGFPSVSCTAIVDLSRETPEIEKLRKRVLDIIDEYRVRGQPVMGQKVPASFVKLAELLSEEASKVKSFPLIRHHQLLNIIRSENLDLDEDLELKQAVSFLHESGVLLHYDETTLQMRDFYFINPGWLCRMMAQIVTVPEINPFINSKGIMKRNSAYMLFTGKKVAWDTNFIFPAEYIPQYLHLLEKFEIALPHNEEELLIPCRLPSMRPSFNIPEQAKKSFRYYTMPFIPIGFWSRLLTRLIVFAQSKFIENLLMLGTEPSEVHYWKEGLFVLWKQNAFFLVDGFRSDSEEVHLTVPATSSGIRLLGYLVDHIDSLIDEWYPGLTSIDPLLGHELLQIYVPCTTCTGPEPNLFLFTELVTLSETKDTVFCPEHKGDVSLFQLAPDVMLTDIESNFLLDAEKFDFKSSPENLLGDGGFGSVYKAYYKGQTVATKVFSPIGDVHPHKMLRQEATIMRRLKHPSVVSLLAVALLPKRLMVMEFAPGRSLQYVLQNKTGLSRTLQHKIILQVAEGLHYLHSLMIVYRDLKPDNVLIFSLVPDAVINAKISDYGISQFTTLSGLMAQEGTYSYRAPEVIRGENYSFQADVFSFGIFMYMVLTGGQHPFEDLDFKSERDKAFADNQPIPPITQRGCAPWPDMQDIINQCMQQVPDYRPRSLDLCEQLNSAELFCLREFLPVSVGTTVECIACQELGNSHNRHLRLWIASGDTDCMQLTWLSLTDFNNKQHRPNQQRPRINDSIGTMFREGRILCVLPLNSEHVLLGTQSGKIWVFNTAYNDLMHASRRLEDSVLCFYLINRTQDSPRLRRDDSLVLAGLANGKIALYPVSEILQEPNMDPIELKLGESYEPLRRIMCSSWEKKIVASCGTKIILIDTSKGVAVEKIVPTDENSGPASQPILTMACGRYIYLSRRTMTVIQAWDIHRERFKAKMDMCDEFRLNPKDGRITATVLHEKVLWIGTGGGQVAMVDVLKWTPLSITYRHTASVRCLLSVRLTGIGKYGPTNTTVILSGGLGFKKGRDAEIDREKQYGCIAVWDADFPQVKKNLADYRSKRKQLLEKL